MLLIRLNLIKIEGITLNFEITVREQPELLPQQAPPAIYTAEIIPFCDLAFGWQNNLEIQLYNFISDITVQVKLEILYGHSG